LILGNYACYGSVLPLSDTSSQGQRGELLNKDPKMLAMRLLRGRVFHVEEEESLKVCSGKAKDIFHEQ
jgi:hypothetical protein